MSPQGWHWQGAVLVTWQLGQCQPDVTTLFPKHAQSTVTTLPRSAYTWGRTKVLGGSVFCELWKDSSCQGWGAVCWDKYCRDSGDQLWRNDILACVFASVSLLLRQEGLQKFKRGSFLFFWEPALWGSLGADLVSWSSQLHCAGAAPSHFPVEKKKYFCLENI